MSDSDVIDIFFRRDGSIIPSKTKSSYIEKNEELTSFLVKRYTDIPDNEFSYLEVITRIFDHIESRNHCKVCDKSIPYTRSKSQTYCSKRCRYLDAASIHEKTIRTCIERYGVKSTFSDPTTKEKIAKTNLERYGSENPFGSKEIQKKIESTHIKKRGVTNASKDPSVKAKTRNTNLNRYGESCIFKVKSFKDRIRRTSIERYGSSNPNGSKSVREKIETTNLERYGFKFPTQNDAVRKKIKQKINTDSAKKKAYRSKKENHSFNSSKPEEMIRSFIEAKYDCFSQFKSESYPFNCDFYIPSLDLYIEYNGFVTHNFKSFDINEDAKELQSLISKSSKGSLYEKIINVWTISDPSKLKIAKEHHLNYLVVYPFWQNGWTSKSKREKFKDKYQESFLKIIDTFQNVYDKQIIIGESKHKCEDSLISSDS